VSIYSPLYEGLHISWVLQAAVLAAAILLSLGFAVRRRLAMPDQGLLPDEGITLRNMIEVVVEGLANLGRATIGPEYRSFFPLVGAIFFFLLISNLLGLVPGVGGASSDINTGVAWAIIVFCVYQFTGIRKKGWSYIEHFMGPVILEKEIGGKTFHVRALAPLLLPIELVLDASRVATLSIRLLANMFADHTVVAIWYGLVPFLIPAVFMGLGVLIAIIQAFVFSLLSMIYIGLVLEESH
jgi:F-type H+-transporting ATPase subunit a